MAGTARRHDWTLRPMPQNQHCSNYMTRKNLYRTGPGLHDTIPSGKDSSKPGRLPHLTRGQSQGSCHNMGRRTCSKIRNKFWSKRNQPSQGLKHGDIQRALQTSSRTPCTQHTLHVHSPFARTMISCNIHSMQNIRKLSLLLGRPDTIPSGKDTDKPARSSDRCREENTDCNI